MRPLPRLTLKALGKKPTGSGQVVCILSDLVAGIICPGPDDFLHQQHPSLKDSEFLNAVTVRYVLPTLSCLNWKRLHFEILERFFSCFSARHNKM